MVRVLIIVVSVYLHLHFSYLGIQVGSRLDAYLNFQLIHLHFGRATCDHRILTFKQILLSPRSLSTMRNQYCTIHNNKPLEIFCKVWLFQIIKKFFSTRKVVLDVVLAGLNVEAVVLPHLKSSQYYLTVIDSNSSYHLLY